MMCNSHHFLRAVLVCVGLTPIPGYTVDLPRCSIASVQMGPMTTGLPTDEPQYVEGRVEVICSGTGREPQIIEFGLIETGIESPRGMPAAAPARSPAGLRVDLFSDGAGQQALPLDASELKYYPTRQIIPGSGDMRLSIPIFARVVGLTLVGSGEYNFTRGIGLLYRVSPAN